MNIVDKGNNKAQNVDSEIEVSSNSNTESEPDAEINEGPENDIKEMGIDANEEGEAEIDKEEASDDNEATAEEYEDTDTDSTGRPKEFNPFDDPSDINSESRTSSYHQQSWKIG